MSNHGDCDVVSRELCEALRDSFVSLDPNIEWIEHPTLCVFTSKGHKHFLYVTHYKRNSSIKIDFLCDPNDSMLNQIIPNWIELKLKKKITHWQKVRPYYFYLSNANLVELTAKFLYYESYSRSLGILGPQLGSWKDEVTGASEYYSSILMSGPYFQSAEVEPPAMVQQSSNPSANLTLAKKLVSPQFDFAKLEANNENLGRAGEKFVFEYEKNRLVQAGKPELARKVEWTSEVKGDGTGYDIISFEISGDLRYIEVKTTKHGPEFPFFISRNEVDFSRKNADAFHLYRVFNFASKPKIFILKGLLDNHCKLTPENYRGSFE